MSAYRRLLDRRVRRSATATVLAAGAVTAALLTAPGPATAAVPTPITCASSGRIWMTATASPYAITRYTVTAPGDQSKPPYAVGSPTNIGSGWNTYGTVLAGPSGYIYGVSSTDGLSAYHYNGTAFDMTKTVIAAAPAFTVYATSPYRTKITVDHDNVILLVDAKGALRSYKYDFTNKKWIYYSHLIATGFGAYDYIFAGDSGVIYARTAAGVLYRARYDIDSERLIEAPKQIGPGWQIYNRLFSEGGDTIYAIDTSNTLWRYYYNETTDATSARQQVGANWTSTNVMGQTNDCTLKSAATVHPAVPQLSTAQDTPVTAIDSGSSLEFAYTDNIGKVYYGHQTSKDAGAPTATFSPLVTPVAQSFAGPPSLAVQPDGKVRIQGHYVEGARTVSYLTAADGSTPSTTPYDEGGLFTGNPVVTTTTNNGLQAVLNTGQGNLWIRRQNTANTIPDDFLPWVSLGGSNLTGTPAVTALPNGVLGIAVADTAHQIWYGEYNTVTAAWTRALAALPSGSFADRPSVTTLPGPKVVVAATTTAGKVKVSLQSASGGAFSSWKDVGDSSTTLAGQASVLLSPRTSKIYVIGRNTSGQIAVATEDAIGAGTWTSAWSTPFSGPPFVTDPTPFVVNGTDVGSIGRFVLRDANKNVYSGNIEVDLFPMSLTGARLQLVGRAPHTNR